MVLYDENKNKIEIYANYENNGIGRGAGGKIYRYGTDKCVKIYYDSCKQSAMLSKTMYESLQNIKSDYFVKIYNLLYTDSSLEQIRGYLMKYYEEKELKILEMRTEYTLYVLEELKKLFNEFTKNNIIADDVKRENIIYDGEKIIVIDPDLFYYGRSSNDYNKMYNYRQLIYLFTSIYLEEVKQFVNLDYRSNPFSVLGQLFDMEYDDNIVDNLSKKLKKYKYPKDYFSERI